MITIPQFALEEVNKKGFLVITKSLHLPILGKADFW